MKTEIEKLVEINEITKKYGLELTSADAKELNDHRLETLKFERRFEFGEGVLSKLIYLFCDSPYIYKENYVETIEGLQEIFYNFKNQYNDHLSDDELLELMKKYFDGRCQGSLELLEEDLWIDRSQNL